MDMFTHIVCGKTSAFNLILPSLLLDDRSF